MSDDTEKKAPESVAGQVKAAVGKAQEETGKLMDSLVKEGEKLRDQTLKLAGDTVGEMKERMNEVRGVVEGVRTKATDTLDNLEQLFEERVARALKRLGVPTRDDLKGIANRLEEIEQIEDNAGKTLISEGVKSGYQDIINYSVFCLIKLGLAA